MITAGRAQRGMARAAGLGCCAAIAAEPVSGAPVHQPAGVRQDRGIGARQQTRHGPQVDEAAAAVRHQRGGIVDRADIDGEQRRLCGREPEQRPWAPGLLERPAPSRLEQHGGG
jgi:hypothetical protein